MILTVANMKGGVGKTTTSVILAEMASRHLKTLLVDMDRQHNAFRKVMKDVDGHFEPAFKKLDSVISDTETPRFQKLNEYDLVIVDTPPRADVQIIRQVLQISNVVVTPFMLGEDEIMGIADLFDILPGDKKLFVFPIWLISPLESSFDKNLFREAVEFFHEFGIEQNEIHRWPMRKTIKNNIGNKKPFYYHLLKKDKDIFENTFRTIMKTRSC